MFSVLITVDMLALVSFSWLMKKFYKITNERGTKTVFTYAHVKWFYGQSERAYCLNYFIKQTLIISPWILFRKMIISHLELGLCQFMYSKQNEIALSFIPTSKLQKKRTSYFNLSIDVWNLFLFVPVHLNASKGKGSLTHLTFKEYLKIYFESLRLIEFGSNQEKK